jgi:hypothetical protein
LEKREIRSGFLVGKSEEKNHLEDLGIGGIILKWLQKE